MQRKCLLVTVRWESLVAEKVRENANKKEPYKKDGFVMFYDRIHRRKREGTFQGSTVLLNWNNTTIKYMECYRWNSRVASLNSTPISHQGLSESLILFRKLGACSRIYQEGVLQTHTHTHTHIRCSVCFELCKIISSSFQIGMIFQNVRSTPATV